ncbi:MAG: type 4a pilus biogenesis protein PilO [Acidobacteriota bacterium]
MKDHLEAWRVGAWVWAAPLTLVVVGILLILFFQTAFAGRVAQLETRYERRGAYLDDLQKERRQVEAFLESTEAQDEAIRVLYHDYFGGESEQFVPTLVEVRELARRAGLDPKSFTYPEDELEGTDLVRRRINFAIEGRYEDLRKYVNLLETTQRFVTLERVSLAGGDPRRARLAIQLSLSTIFARRLDAMDAPTALEPTSESAAETSAEATAETESAPEGEAS